MGLRRQRVNSSWFFRILDANLNRSREGLRVCEDLARFVLKNKYLTDEFRKLRHSLSDTLKLFGFLELLEARNSPGDIGRILPYERYKMGVRDIFFANIQRAKESVRVLEELSRAHNINLSKKIRDIRFRIYHLEKMAYERI